VKCILITWSTILKMSMHLSGWHTKSDLAYQRLAMHELVQSHKLIFVQTLMKKIHLLSLLRSDLCVKWQES
jgi:hypothetical protein